MTNQTSTRRAPAVPMTALGLSLLAMTGAAGAAIFWPQELVNQETLAGGLALLPALLLAHYRGWGHISVLLGLGLVALTTLHIAAVFHDLSFLRSFQMLFVVAPYIAIALGAGWFGEVQRYQGRLEATQQQLIQAEKLESIGRMAAGVAHEVKNPLMTILTGLAILSPRLEDTDDALRQIVQDMTNAVSRADQIVRGLLNYSRNDVVLNLVEADVNALIDRSLLLVKHQLDKTRIAVRTKLDPSLPPVRLDELKLEQVLVNVLGNAIDAMEHDGEIVLTTAVEPLRKGGLGLVGSRQTDRFRPNERAVIIRVEDSGPGIPEDHLRKVWDPFFTTKPVGKGTGLGLSVCQQILEMHGGAIEIGNRLGGGARVTIALKLDQKER